MHKTMAILGAGALALAAPVSAATLVTDTNGQLIGATGVMVDGTSYDVSFEEGTCPVLFSGCDGTTDFAFDTMAGADLAAAALLSQVFVGVYDLDPALTIGCTNTATCGALVPYAILVDDVILRSAVNFAGAGGVTAGTTLSRGFDTTQSSNGVFAVFSKSVPAVPEPASWLMMILGLGALGGLMRHSRRARRQLRVV